MESIYSNVFKKRSLMTNNTSNFMLTDDKKYVYSTIRTHVCKSQYIFIWSKTKKRYRLFDVRNLNTL